MTFTTQSASVPLVEAVRLTIGWPLILTGAVRTSEAKARTSGRPEASRWSLTNHCAQAAPLARTGRGMNGTGLAGSDTYSSYPAPPGAGADRVALGPGPRRSGVGTIRHPVEQPAGHADSRRQTFVPVSNAVT